MKTILLFTLFISSAHSFSKELNLPTPAHVDVKRYLGKWYAITSLPQFFTRNCVAQTAEYGAIDEQTISVLNTCIEKDGTSNIKGKAAIVNKTTNAELEVSFYNFFTKLFGVKGDYTILELDSNYKYVMVGSKNRKSLWIMSRTTSIPDLINQSYIQKAKSLGFDVEDLEDSKFSKP